MNTAPTLNNTADQNSGTPVAGTSNILIGNRADSARTFDGDIPMLTIVEGILTLEQITNFWYQTKGWIQ